MEKVIRTCCQSSHCECGVRVHVRDGKVTKIEGDPQHPFTRGFACVKARAQHQLIYHPDRLKHPLKRAGERGAGKWKGISWGEALRSISAKLGEIKDAYAPESSASIHGTGPRSATPACTLLAHALGSPNVISTDLHICYAPSTIVGVCTFGHSIMMDAGPDYGASQCILVWGANPVTSHGPRGRDILEAKKRGAKIIVVDPRRTTLAGLAHVVLPAAYWAEKEGTVTGTERRVQWMHKAIAPTAGSKPDWRIICDVANKLGFSFRYNGPEEILREINKVIPSFTGITPERLKEKMGGIQWPCPTPEHPGTPILHVERFATGDGLARLNPVEHRPPVEKTSEEYPLVLTTGRIVMHYNSGSETRRSASLLKRSPEPYVEINPADAQGQGIGNGEEVAVINKRGEVRVKAAITNNVPRGVVFMHFHFPGTANILTLHDLDPVAKVPEYKVAACRIERRG